MNVLDFLDKSLATRFRFVLNARSANGYMGSSNYYRVVSFFAALIYILKVDIFVFSHV